MGNDDDDLKRFINAGIDGGVKEPNEDEDDEDDRESLIVPRVRLMNDGVVKDLCHLWGRYR